MKFSLTPNRTSMALLTLTALAVTSCGDDSSSNDDNSSKSEEVETSLVSEHSSSDEAVLRFSSNKDGAVYQCKVDTVINKQPSGNQNWSRCDDDLSVPLPKGSDVTVSVRAMSKDGKVDQTPLVRTFKGQPSQSNPTQNPTQNPGQVGQTPGQTGQMPGQVGQYPGQTGQMPGQVGQYPGQTGQYPTQARRYDLQSMTIGHNWVFQIPQNMHVLQYAAQGTIGAGIDVLQIKQGEDANYFGLYPGSFISNNTCSRFASQEIGVRSPSGQTMSYCAGKVNGTQQVKKMLGHEYAANHIEVGSDAGSATQTRMLVQVYNNYNISRSILNALCGSQANSSGVTDVFRNIPIINDFWDYNWATRNVKTCNVSLNGFTGGRWQVVGFVGALGGNKALEVVYMQRNDSGMVQYNDYFARDFQRLMLNNFSKENGY